MMKVFISQPMRGKPEAEILGERCNALTLARQHYGNLNMEIIDTFFKDFDGNRPEFLGKSVMEGLARADAAVFLCERGRF
jgi:hypothetical protein